MTLFEWLVTVQMVVMGVAGLFVWLMGRDRAGVELRLTSIEKEVDRLRQRYHDDQQRAQRNILEMSESMVNARFFDSMMTDIRRRLDALERRP